MSLKVTFEDLKMRSFSRGVPQRVEASIITLG